MDTSQTASPSQGAPKGLVGLPLDILNRIGDELSRKDRGTLLRAAPGLKLHHSTLFRSDILYDYLVPRSLQQPGPVRQSSASDAITPSRPQRSEASVQQEMQRRQQQWLLLYRALRDAPVPPQSTGQAPLNEPVYRYPEGHVVRHGEAHAIETVVPLPEDHTVLLVGPEPSGADDDFLPQERAVRYCIAPADDPQQPWVSTPVQVTRGWQKPASLVRAGRDNIFATRDVNDILRLWHFKGSMLQQLGLVDGLDGIECKAQSMAFTREGELPHCVFYGSIADSDVNWLNGIKLLAHPSLDPRDAPVLQFVQNRCCGELNAGRVSHLAMSLHHDTALSVNEFGEVVLCAVPFDGSALPIKRSYKPVITRIEAKKYTINDHGNCLAVHYERNANNFCLEVFRYDDKAHAKVWSWPGAIKQRLDGPSNLLVDDFKINQDGSRLGVLLNDKTLQVWSIPSVRKRPVSPTLFSRAKPVSHIDLVRDKIISFEFSPYSHALLVTTRHTTHIVLPFKDPIKVPLPHLSGTGFFLPGMLRVAGIKDAKLHEIDVAARFDKACALPLPQR